MASLYGPDVQEQLLDFFFVFFYPESVLFSLLCPNHLQQSFITQLFLTSRPLLPPIHRSVCVSYPTLCAIDPLCGIPLLVSAPNAGSSASQVSLSCLQTHLRCYWTRTHTYTHTCTMHTRAQCTHVAHADTHTHANVHLSLCPTRGLTFIGFSSFFCSGEQGQASSDLTSAAASD